MSTRFRRYCARRHRIRTAILGGVFCASLAVWPPGTLWADCGWVFLFPEVPTGSSYLQKWNGYSPDWLGFEAWCDAYHNVEIHGLNAIDPSAPAVYPNDSEGNPHWYQAYYVTCLIPGQCTVTAVCSECGMKNTVVRVSDISTVTWTEYVDPVTLVANPLYANDSMPGGGLKIYPGWRWGVLWDPSPIQKSAYVGVRVVVLPPPDDPCQPLDVTLVAYDVDDPSSNENPLDQEYLGPGTPNYHDNRCGRNACGFVSGFQRNENWTKHHVPVSGLVDAVFCAAPGQFATAGPGDNWRVSADFGPGFTNTFVARQDDGELARLVRYDCPLPPQDPSPEHLAPGNLFTLDILTVWRKVHVETDTMSDVDPDVNRFGGTVVGYEDWVGGADPDTLIIQQNVDSPTPAGPIEEIWSNPWTSRFTGRFENGKLWRPAGNGKPEIIKDGLLDVGRAAGPPTLVAIRDESGDIAVGDTVFLYDDDHPGWPPASKGLVPYTYPPDFFDSLNFIYKQAYIEFENDGAGGINGDEYWGNPYWVFPPQIVYQVYRQSHANGSSFFWTAYITWLYQNTDNDCNDPNVLLPYYSVSPGLYNQADTPGVYLFRETMDDYCLGELYVAAHELGHGFGLGDLVIWGEIGNGVQVAPLEWDVYLFESLPDGASVEGGWFEFETTQGELVVAEIIGAWNMNPPTQMYTIVRIRDPKDKKHLLVAPVHKNKYWIRGADIMGANEVGWFSLLNIDKLRHTTIRLD